MRQRGKDGKFANKTKKGPIDLATDRGKGPPMSPSRLRHCRKLVVYKVAEAMPAVVDSLVVESRKGSFEHTKEILKLAHANQEKATAVAPGERGGGFVRRLLVKIQKEGDASANSDMQGPIPLNDNVRAID